MSKDPRHPETAQRVMADGVAAAISADGDMPLRWVAVVESMDPDGHRCMWRFGSEGLTAWDGLSLHEYAMTKQRAELMRDELNNG